MKWLQSLAVDSAQGWKQRIYFVQLRVNITRIIMIVYFYNQVGRTPLDWFLSAFGKTCYVLSRHVFACCCPSSRDSSQSTTDRGGQIVASNTLGEHPKPPSPLKGTQNRLAGGCLSRFPQFSVVYGNLPFPAFHNCFDASRVVHVLNI